MNRYPLTSDQYGLTLVRLASFDNKWKEQLVIPFICISPENIDKDQSEISNAIEKSWNRVVEENDALRLCYTGVPLRRRQYVADFVYREVETEAYPGTYEELKGELLKRDHYITLRSNPMWRVTSYLLADGRVATFFVISHYNFDGYSLSLIYKQLSDAFVSYLNGEEPPFKSRPSYIKYLEDQKKYRGSKSYRDDFSFWWKKFNNRRGYKFAGGRASSDTRADTITFDIKNESYEKASMLAANLGIPLSFLALSVMAFTTYKRTHCEDFSLYCLLHGRIKLSEKRTMGDMANNLPVFFNFADKDKTKIADFIESSYEEYIESMKHSKFPVTMGVVVSFKEAVRNFNFFPTWLYFSVVDHENVSKESVLTFDAMPSISLSSLLYFSFMHFPDDRIHFELSYQVKKYTREKIDRLIRDGITVLEFILKNPEQTIGELPDLSE